MAFMLPELDRKATQKAVEEIFETYRHYKYWAGKDREASITASTEIRYHGPTNQTSDQTGDIAAHNVDQQRMREKYCNRIERAVKRLPKNERALIQARYMDEESDYTNDYNVYSDILHISVPTYRKWRWKAFYRLALSLDLDITKGEK